MKINDELISNVAAAIRYAYAVAAQPMFPPDLDLVGSVDEWRGEAESAINAVFDSDMFARIVRDARADALRKVIAALDDADIAPLHVIDWLDAYVAGGGS